MRFFIHLLTLVALMAAPLAASAAAMTVAPRAAECTEIAMDMAGHEMPAGDRGEDKACCIAIPPAIDPPLSAIDASAAIEHLAYVAAIEPFYLGAGPKAEDPPPRKA